MRVKRFLNQILEFIFFAFSVNFATINNVSNKSFALGRLLNKPGLVWLFQNVYVAGIYFLTGMIGLQFASIANQVTLFWPPSGVALAFLFLFRYRVWPGVLLASILINASSGAPPIFVALGMVGNTLCGIFGAWLLRRFRFEPRMESLRDVFLFLVAGCMASPLISSIIGSAALWLSGVIPPTMYAESLLTWWLGDAIGVLAIGAPILIWVSQPISWPGWKRITEAASLALILALAGWQIYLYSSGGETSFLLNYLIFPLVVWAAVRFGQRGASLVNLGVVLLAIYGLAQNKGPFFQRDLYTNMLLLNGFLAMLVVSSLMLSSTIEERRKAEEGRNALVRQRQLYSLLLDMSSSLDLDLVMRDVARRTVETLSAQAGSFVLISTDGRMLDFAACYHTDDRCGENIDFRAMEEILCWETLHVGDLHTVNFLEQPKRYAYVIAKGYTCWMGVPMQVADEMIGVISLFRAGKAGNFESAEILLARLISRQAGIVIQNARSYAELQRTAISDPLTGLFNRRHFMEMAALEIERVRQKNTSLAMMMVDMDHFKAVNDTHGHVVGDQALYQLAQILKQGMRENDILARYGGEEFIILLNEVDYEEAREIAERLRRLVEESPLIFRGQKILLQISVGGVMMRPGCEDLACLVENADLAMYQAKQDGRNRVVFRED